MVSTNEPSSREREVLGKVGEREGGEVLCESSAEPSEGGGLQPETAESISARWKSVIIEMCEEDRWNPDGEWWSAANTEGVA